MGQCNSVEKGAVDTCFDWCCSSCCTCDSELCTDCIEIGKDEKDGDVIPLPTLPADLGIYSF